MRHLTTFTLTTLVLALAACGPRTFDLAPPSADNTLDKAPKWMLDVPEADDRLLASATATSRDFQVAVDKAQAQVDIARQLGNRMSNLTRQFSEEVGLAADSQLLSEFSTVTKSVVDENLVGEANRMLLDKLRSKEALLTRFRATQTYAELEAELERTRAEPTTH